MRSPRALSTDPLADPRLARLQLLLEEIFGTPSADGTVALPALEEMAGEYRGVRWVARVVPRRLSPGLPQWWLFFGRGATRLHHASARDTEQQVRAWVERWADAHPGEWRSSSPVAWSA